MSRLPPVINDVLFSDLDRAPREVERIFNPIIRQLIEYLNNLPCLEDIQDIRRQEFNKRPKSKTAFKFPANHLDTRHWYFFNVGGRNEMQFNIGMYSANDPASPYVRIGIGFNFDGGAYGDRDAVAKAFSLFCTNVIRQRSIFENFFQRNSLQVEFNSRVNSNTVVEWLQVEARKDLGAHNEHWVFIGAQLHRGKDRAVLEDPKRLDQVIVSVFSGFKPFFRS